MKKKLRFKNTYKSGAVSYVGFKEKDKFVAVCLEFDLVAEGETLKDVKERIEDLSNAWLHNVIKNKLPEELLNKSAPRKYWQIYENARNEQEDKKRLTIPDIYPIPVMSQFQRYAPQYPLFNN